MKKLLCLIAACSFISFAQNPVLEDIAIPSETGHDYTEMYADDFANPYGTQIGDRFGMNFLPTALTVIFGILVYAVGPILAYIMGSYGLVLIDRTYQKKDRSGISWVPFARYYNVVKNATQSEQTAFYVTVLPWLIVFIGVIGVIVGGVVSSHSDTDEVSMISMVFGGVGALGLLSIIVMNFWRAFIISRYVKGDTTTALGLSTYTCIVLWYIGLDRFYHKTDIIGKLGFILMGVFIVFYIVIIAVMFYNMALGGH